MTTAARSISLCAILVLGTILLSGCGKKAPHEANPTEVKEFFTAVEDGDAEIISRLLKAKPYLANASNDSGETALSIAKKKNNEEMVDALKKAGAK